MAGLGDIILGNKHKEFEEKVKAIEPKYKKRIEENLENAKKKYGSWQDEKIEEYRKWFNSVIVEWYGEYSPTVYSRNRSLKNIFDVEKDNDMNLTAVYDENKMTGYRSGFKGGEDTESLFKLVFIEGWHGGAKYRKSGDYSIRHKKDGTEYKVYDPHPDPGTPYYRRPVPTYSEWGKRSTKPFSPYEKIDTKIQLDMNSGIYGQKANELQIEAINLAKEYALNLLY